MTLRHDRYDRVMLGVTRALAGLGLTLTGVSFPASADPAPSPIPPHRPFKAQDR
jgi:hypothetical protein